MSIASSQLKRLTLLATFVPVVLLAGCANMATTAPATNSFPSIATITGQLHGGNQPIVGSSVTLYSAGITGYGSLPTQFAQTTSANDNSGSFSFNKVAPSSSFPTGVHDTGQNTYSCPTSGDPQIYIVARGGSTQGPFSPLNSAAVFIAALGKCSTISSSTFVDMNEVTTVGTLAALQQYFNPSTQSFGYPATAQAALGFANGIATIANLVNIAAGTTVTSNTLTGTVSGTSVTITPETAKINTIANILAACVNTISNTSDNCNTLFTNAVPPASSNVTSQPGSTYLQATNTLQAGYFMLVNSTNSQSPTKLSALYGLSSPAAPFQPSLTAVPTDWTIGIGYAAPTANACATGSFFSYPSTLAVDSTGNVWFSNSSTAPAASNLAGLSPTGAPIACVGGDTITGNTFGVTVDTTDSIWMSSGTVAKTLQYKGGSPIYWTAASTASEQIVADGNGNIFYADNVGKTVQEYVGAATAASPAASVQIGGATGSSPFYMAVDGLGNVFVTQTSTTNTFYEFYPTTVSGNVGGYLSQTILTPGTNVYNPYGVAISSSNKTAGTSSFVVLNGANAVPGQTVLPVSVTASTATPATAPTITPGTLSAACAGGIYKGRGLGIDGAGNIFVAAEGIANSIAEVAADGTPLSPPFNNPATCNSATGGTGGFQKSLFGTLHNLAIDPSGNVWVGSSGSPLGIVEIVGAAVPVVTPTSVGLANNTVGTKP